MMCRCRTPGIFLAALLLTGATAHAQGPPDWLPRYDLRLRVDPTSRTIQGKMLVTWTNTDSQPRREIVFNAHARYSIPGDDVGLIAKTVEMLRLAPSETMSFDGPALEVNEVLLHYFAKPGEGVKPARADDARPVGLSHYYMKDNPTALVVELPKHVEPGEQVTLQLTLSYQLPPRKARWGQWDGVTVLAQGLPTIAVLDEKGWQPAPFIPWHQPFFNEAGVYTAAISLPAEQKLACSAPVTRITPCGEGWVTHECEPICVRDFSFMCSARYEEHCGKADGINIRVLALPEHAHHGKEIVRYISEAIPVYNQWFGRYPYSQFTIADAYFGWNGNECGALVMIDTRMMGMPKMAHAYIDYLVSHELSHQWWYNVVGTNGYAETWMDEGLATYFTHRLMDQKRGRENRILEYPSGLEWLPNIRREDFRNYGYLSAARRGDAMPTVQAMPEYRHLGNLSAMTYDRGMKVVGLIEQRLGPDNMLDFMRCIFRKYQFRILRVADFQKELEAYTGEPWQDFFQHWVYGKGQCDWAVERVEVQGDQRPLVRLLNHRKRGKEPVRVTIRLRQQGEFNEATVLGIRLKSGDGYPIRIPIHPQIPVLELEQVGAVVHCTLVENKSHKGCTPGAIVCVDITLPCAPEQVSVDPDRILLDERPANNHWKSEIRWRWTPLYTQLEESDVTTPHDRPSLIFGPWLFGSAYADPWFTKSPLLGLRAGVYRPQEYSAGVFAAYRTNDRNAVVGAEGTLDHWPFPQAQVGFFVERQLGTYAGEDIPCSRGVVYGRYILTRGSSLYLPPFEYVETFAAYQNRGLPNPRTTPPTNTDEFEERFGIGVHYHKYFLTPYWNPEGGVALDVTYQEGLPIFGNQHTYHQVYGQVSWVKSMPKMAWLGDGPVRDYLRNTRWAFRMGGAAALPLRGMFFTLGGADAFRGFDLSERQGSVTWVGSVEWRLPLFEHANLNLCDNVAGVRGLYLAPFYDVGDAYVNNRSYGSVAHAVGAGLRLDVIWLGLIERTMFRLDFAKTLNSDAPWQIWFGVMHPF